MTYRSHWAEMSEKMGSFDISEEMAKINTSVWDAAQDEWKCTFRAA